MTRPDPTITRLETSSRFVSQRVLGELGRRILAGQYAQHSALPTELQLCAEFGVSRTAMREATKMLAAKGLVVSRKRAGTLVQDSSLWNRLDVDVLSWMSATDPDPEFVRGLIEARLAIEPAAAELAARRASAGDLARIEAGYLAMRAADLGDLAACAEAAVRFPPHRPRRPRRPRPLPRGRRPLPCQHPCRQPQSGVRGTGQPDRPGAGE